MNKLLSLTITAGMAISISASAEIAVLCGNLRAIESNEKNAIVHVDFDWIWV